MTISPSKLLPREDWLIKRFGPDHVAAGIYEHPPGVMWWEKIALRDLPNDLVGREDLEGFGIDLVDVAAIVEDEPPRAGKLG